MQLTPKQISFLEDLISQETTCIEKYERYSQMAFSGSLKNLFSDLANSEKSHKVTLEKIIGGCCPEFSNSQPQASTFSKFDYSTNDNRNSDSFLCKDSLSMEKHVSSVYDTSIFEMSDQCIRAALNHIQKEEQSHGESIYNYLSANSMYF